jgi:hypothetical protein
VQPRAILINKPLIVVRTTSSDHISVTQGKEYAAKALLIYYKFPQTKSDFRFVSSVVLISRVFCPSKKTRIPKLLPQKKFSSFIRLHFPFPFPFPRPDYFPIVLHSSPFRPSDPVLNDRPITCWARASNFSSSSSSFFAAAAAASVFFPSRTPNSLPVRTD